MEINMARLCITTECVCDLPRELLNSFDIDIIYFHIYTESGCFQDTDEIDARNILEYMENGGTKSQSSAPSANEYKKFFQNKLENYDEIIHIAISSGISESVRYASLAVAKMGIDGRKIHVFDSGHLSSGMGIMALRAAQMNREGKSTRQILEALSDMKEHVSTSFIVKNADYLYRNQKVSRQIRNLCNFFSLHPVLYMKNGRLTMKGIRIGNYEEAGIRYVKKELAHTEQIDKAHLFITHASCSSRHLQQIEKTAASCCSFDKITVNSASASVSSNCGPDAFGVLFLMK